MLTLLSWPAEVERRFLRNLEAGRETLPRVAPLTIDLTETRSSLHALGNELRDDHPAIAFLRRTALAYGLAAELLESTGTPRFAALSKTLFGVPEDRLHPASPSHSETADHFLANTRPLGETPTPEVTTLSAEAAAEMIRARLEGVFDPPLPVVLAPGLRALSTAGAKRVRLRAGARLTPLQVEQLLHHEAMVHSATKRNGRAQPVLSCLGLSSPRTTCTQEGLATLAELLTDSMDLRRLRRIALRIKAVEAGIAGADFIEVFRLFREAGSDARDAFRDAARIFRGGDVRGGIVFTKDVVYLKGLLLVHSFLVKASQEGLHGLGEVLFAGRMTIRDALELAPFLGTELLARPKVMPSWVANGRCLTAYMLFTAYGPQLRLAMLGLNELAEHDQTISSE